MKHLKRMDESILVCVYYGLNGERLIRRGHKLATLLDCPLYILTVDAKAVDAFDAEKSGYIESWTDLCKELEVEEFIVRDDEKQPIQKVIGEIAREKNITQIIVGQSAQSRWEEITKGSFLNVLLKEVPFVDFHIVAVKRPIEEEAHGTYEKGVRAYVMQDLENYKIVFTCPKSVSIEGIFFKEIGTDFDNGIFKFSYQNKMHEVRIKEGFVTNPHLIHSIYGISNV
ncbi:adenine nucleotide alpha hydrolase family protein [Ureibacillus chungkukjangi]|uniref:Universal stress protein family protein n=1 Tax=Ureibacillus chungkukjangi TaxID=1202712 RepID=A0A318U328_9BACL|nr:histidine kinase [Ureibacillus chungkukjangi]MCM3390127.1 histidine kinase [Ureibacillus chungkukjangi]PYF06319.1 universal stress protein family protein [Ureibacillus chungkukjangi]